MCKGAIVLRARGPSSPVVRAAELRLRGLVGEVDALDAEVERQSGELARFEAIYLHATGDAFAELDRAQRLARRARRLADEVARLLELLRQGNGSAPRARRRRPSDGTGESFSRARVARSPRQGEEPALDRSGPELRSLHRRLARFLHPDLVQGDEGERARRSDLMARANDAYARGDLAALELLAERAGVGAEWKGEAEQLTHLDHRISTLESMRARLAAQRARLLASEVAQLREATLCRAAAGGDLLAESRAEAEMAARTARDESLAVLEQLVPQVRALARARREALARRSSPGGRPRNRSHDPVARSLLARRARSAQRGRAITAVARLLSLALEKQSERPEPWEALLILLALMGEVAGRLPESL
ncbi:MAG TPA: molecular chaperone DnaJ, partial [Anaeromyxobacteraceae bacterium]|nr:molecular chaperone DnaJ [Anaeromyxobacteraceae bacterium]